MRPLNLIFLLLLILFSGICAAQELEVGRPEKADLSKSIVVYPNPAIDFVNVKLAEFNAHDAKVKLYNILGNEIPTETEVVDDHMVRVRVKELATGYYLVAVHDEHTKFKGTFKFLKR